MKKPFLLFLFSFGILFAQNYSDFVKPIIGTAGTGHTYPGATLPYAMVQLSPDTRVDGSWEGCSGYAYKDKIIYGFSHTHLSGTGCSDYGDIMLMPVTHQPSAFVQGDYASRYDHADEKAEAGFYSVKLQGNDVTVNLTSTLRTGFHQYIFHEKEHAMVVLNLNHRDELLDGEIEMVDDHTVSGYRYSKAWAQNQKIFYYIEFSRKIKSAPALDDSIKLRSFKRINGKQLCANFFFDLNTNDTLLVKVGISGTSVEGARLNLQKENPGWNFNAIKQEAKDAWNKELSKIEVICEKRSDYEVFYTALYHTMVVPNTWNDVDGKYRGRDDQIHTKEEGNYYTVFSLWDTFRAAHPLYTLIDQRRSKDYVLTFIRQYQEGGRLPVWELSSNETECMIGIHSISVIADAVSKGLVEDKYKGVLGEAMVATARMEGYKGLDMMAANNYLTVEMESESVSKTLEYCYQFYCMSKISRWAGMEVEANLFENISLGYKNIFNPDTGFFVPRSNGNWLPGFDPRQVNNHFTEANAWQYTFFVPHDITGMIELYGGREKFHRKLDSLFGTSSNMTGREQADITGLIGQYAHGNEPSHHVAYLYNYVGDFRNANKIITKICNDFYSNKPDGLAGNEDCGQMSAWYVLSSLGLYQVSPGSPNYTITIPQVLSAEIHLENGETISIKKDQGDAINSIFWNGAKYEKLYISYDELMKGGELYFKKPVGNKLTLATDIKEGDILSTSDMKGEKYIPAPIIKIGSPIFEKETTVEIKSYHPGAKIFYILKYAKGKPTFKPYKKPFKVKANCQIFAYVQTQKKGAKSPTAEAEAHQRPNDYSIEIKSKVHPQYGAGGPLSLMDGVKGDRDWRKGNWLGYQGQNFEAIIDLKKPTKLNTVSCGFLHDLRAWIIAPVGIEFYGSTDGQNYELVAAQAEQGDDKNEEIYLKKMEGSFGGKEFRYVKVVVENYGDLPKGHPGAGNPAYIFIDEIEFN